jgi:hypothetical protein
MRDKRDWLILSLKWSTGELLKWYATAAAGYTTSLLRAGRYTEEEARSEQDRCPDHCHAVPLDSVAAFVGVDAVIRNDGRTVKRLKRALVSSRS